MGRGRKGWGHDTCTIVWTACPHPENLTVFSSESYLITLNKYPVIDQLKKKQKKQLILFVNIYVLLDGRIGCQISSIGSLPLS